jgi:hypothetical protein
MEKLRKLIRESILRVIKEENEVPLGVVDGKGQPIRTGKMARPMDANDKRWGQVAGITIDLKVRINWSDPTSKQTGKTKTAEDPKTIEIY